MIVNPNGLVPVHLLVNHGSNRAGELCGFPPEEAARLVAAGAATYYEPGAAITAVESAPRLEKSVVVPVIGANVDGSWLSDPKPAGPPARRGGRR